MTDLVAPTRLGTHDVVNQPGETPDHDAYARDPLLPSLVERWNLGWASERFSALGRVAGAQSTERLARDANRHEPQLRTFDRFGRRIDEVEFHPAYHQLMALAFGHEVHSLGWTGDGPNPHMARAVQSYLWNQAENGVGCPTAMTYASIVPFRTRPDLGEVWVPKVLSREYDPRPLPVEHKTGVTIGMAMTEKQGGSDLRQTRTTATLVGDGAGWYEITGHKWFTSVPMSDGFFTLARTEDGVSCLFFPRWLPDGSVNRMLIQRLKDKCGNRSNASSEIELDGCLGVLVGEPGHGIRAILGQGHLTRLDFAVGSAGLMRKALTHALHHTTHRRAFDRTLHDLPMVRGVLADLAVEVEAATVLGLRMALALDRSADDLGERLLARIATPLAKYWNCRRAVSVVVEALELHGGNGFIEDGPIARLYREAPLNAIWEGTSNMMCLDVLRSLRREPDARHVLLDELRAVRGGDTRLDAAVDELDDLLGSDDDLEPAARWIADRAAICLSASLLLQCGDADVAEAYIGARLGGASSFGGLRPSPALAAIVERARVAS